MIALIYPGGLAPDSLFAEEFLTRYGRFGTTIDKATLGRIALRRIACDIVDPHDSRLC
ncbi:MAG TPA: hypothetical protein VGI25_02915 [Candidatus Udaeobacter sp.]